MQSDQSSGDQHLRARFGLHGKTAFVTGKRIESEQFQCHECRGSKGMRSMGLCSDRLVRLFGILFSLKLLLRWNSPSRIDPNRRIREASQARAHFRHTDSLDPQHPVPRIDLSCRIHPCWLVTDEVLWSQVVRRRSEKRLWKSWPHWEQR